VTVEEWTARYVDRPRPEGAELVLDSVVVNDGDYSELKLSRFVAIGSRFSGCSFENMRIGMLSIGAGKKVSEYVGCSFDGSRLELHPGGFARFVDCSFRDVAITHWTASAADVIGCTFSGKIKTAIFYGTVSGPEARAGSIVLVWGGDRLLPEPAEV
jgi:hypothetical protein